MQPFESKTTREKLCIINGSIWASSAHKTLDSNGYSGIAEYSLASNKIVSITPYPSFTKPNRHCLCKYKDKIIIINGENNQIIEFDTASKEFTSKRTLTDIGNYPSAVCIKDKIHIMHGGRNSKHHVIYDVDTNNLRYLKDASLDVGMTAVAVLKYEDRIIKIGGSGGSYRTTFLISDEIDEDIDENYTIKWTEKKEWKLPKKIYRFGHVIYKDYVIIFGGNMFDRSKSGCYAMLNGIYVLDLQSNDGWEEIKHIECPLGADYIVTLAPDNFIHLVTEVTVWPNWEDGEMRHFAIHVSSILGNRFTSSH